MTMKRNPANRNITRIELKPVEGKAQVKGWEVRIHRRGERFNQFFSDKAHGGKTKALQTARDLRDKMVLKLKPYTRRELASIVSTRNISGHRGVRLRISRVTNGEKKYVYEHIEASWSPEKGVVVKRSFSVKQLGLEKAWKLAIACRKKAVAALK